MIGWSKRSRRRRLQFTPEEEQLEERYQRMVDRRYFPLLALVLLVDCLLVALLDLPLSANPKGVGTVMIFLTCTSLVVPLLFIPSREKWRARERDHRETEDGS